MAWTAPADHAATVVSVAEWNSFHGTSGNCAYLKTVADAPMKVQKAGADIGTQAKINIIEGTNITATVADDAANNRVNITLAASGGNVPTQAESSASAGGGTHYQTLTSNASPNVKGSWVDVIASTAFAVIHLVISCRVVGASSFLVDIGTGAGPTVLIPDLWIGGAAGIYQTYCFPMTIAASTKISARCCDSTGGLTCNINIVTLG